MMKTKGIALKLINVLMFLFVPMSVVFLISLTLVLIEGKPIQTGRLSFFFSVVALTVVLKVVKSSLSKGTGGRE
jgi:hypothetical protein